MMRKLLCLFSVLLCLSFPSCTEVECPLDSVVVMTCGLYDADTKAELSLQQTLTIKPSGKDTVLLNAAQNIQNFVLPLKLGGVCDTMLLHFTDDWGAEVVDTLFVSHTNNPHFESVECPATIFFNLTNVGYNNSKESLTPVCIDSVAIVRGLVDYYDVENVQIYLRVAP